VLRDHAAVGDKLAVVVLKDTANDGGIAGLLAVLDAQ
jgi:hypothetical protein